MEMTELEFKGGKSFNAKNIFASNIFKIYLYGKITKYFPLDSIVNGVIGLPINIYSDCSSTII